MVHDGNFYFPRRRRDGDAVRMRGCGRKAFGVPKYGHPPFELLLKIVTHCNDCRRRKRHAETNRHAAEHPELPRVCSVREHKDWERIGDMLARHGLPQMCRELPQDGRVAFPEFALLIAVPSVPGSQERAMKVLAGFVLGLVGLAVAGVT